MLFSISINLTDSLEPLILVFPWAIALLPAKAMELWLASGPAASLPAGDGGGQHHPKRFSGPSSTDGWWPFQF
jgi:hypothetical protein